MINDFLSSGELFYDENSYNVPVEAIKADLDFRPVANKDLVGEPLLDGIWDEENNKHYVTPAATRPETLPGETDNDLEDETEGGENA